MSVKRYATVGLIVLALLGNAYTDQKQPSGMLVDNSLVSQMKLLTAGDIPNLLDQLEYYDHAVPFVFRKDLNGDGVEDFLIVSAASLCGTGGCPYALVDGKSMRQVGDFFGSPILISAQKINHYPVIQSYSLISAGSGNFITYVYDGKRGRVGVTSYWRTLKSGGEINPKYPGGIEEQRARLESEGHRVIRKGRKYLAEDYEKYLIQG